MLNLRKLILLSILLGFFGFADAGVQDVVKPIVGPVRSVLSPITKPVKSLVSPVSRPVLTAVTSQPIKKIIEPVKDLIRSNDSKNLLFSEGLEYGSYYKGPVCQPSQRIRHPTTVQEIISIVKEAIREGLTVKAFGFQHSASDVICTDGIPVSMMGIKGMEMSRDNRIVTVGAGEIMYSVTKFLRTKGRGLKTTPAFGNITIGGAIGTGAHGSSIKYTSSISEQVEGVEIVDGRGRLRTITDTRELRAFRVHLGLLGIVTKVMLRTERDYKVRAHNYVTSDEMLLNGSIVDIAREADQISIYWFPSFRKLVIANWTILEDVRSNRGEAYTFDHVPSTFNPVHDLAAAALETSQNADSSVTLNVFQAYTMRTLHDNTPGFVPIYTEDGNKVKNPAVGWYDDMFAPTCNETGTLQCVWFHGPNNLTLLDNEISFPLEELPAFAAKLQDIVSKYTATFPFQGILLRFSAGTETFMSTAQGRDTCHFEWYVPTRKDQYETASSGLAAYQALLQTMAFEHNGRSHWGKTGFYYHTTELIDMKLDPSAKSSFIAKMNQYDPNGVFMNDFGRRLKGIGTKINWDPKTTHCALLDNCVCQKDDDCAKGQNCGTIKGYPNYPVCLTKGHKLEILNPNPIINESFETFLSGVLKTIIKTVNLVI